MYDVFVANLTRADMTCWTFSRFEELPRSYILLIVAFLYGIVTLFALSKLLHGIFVGIFPLQSFKSFFLLTITLAMFSRTYHHLSFVTDPLEVRYLPVITFCFQLPVVLQFLVCIIFVFSFIASLSFLKVNTLHWFIPFVTGFVIFAVLVTLYTANIATEPTLTPHTSSWDESPNVTQAFLILTLHFSATCCVVCVIMLCIIFYLQHLIKDLSVPTIMKKNLLVSRRFLFLFSSIQFFRTVWSYSFELKLNPVAHYFAIWKNSSETVWKILLVNGILRLLLEVFPCLWTVSVVDKLFPNEERRQLFKEDSVGEFLTSPRY
ncbi:hypothetical protein RCL1_008538 [Eukaryota sp. TZLM3-RCL]